ncbi:MAG: hypothetical protein ACLR3C_12020 [Eggerthella lenta]
MSFALNPYTAPDFHREPLAGAPDAVLLPAPKDGVAPEGYHAMSIYPEYFKIDGAWLLAEDSRMDCVPVCEDGRIFVREFRHIRAGDAIVCGRTESGEQASTSTRPGSTPRRTAKASWPTQGATPTTSPSAGALARDGVLPRVRRALRAAEARARTRLRRVGDGRRSRSTASRARRSPRSSRRATSTRCSPETRWPHDLEGSYFHTALGQDIETQENRPLGHYNHLDTINRVRLYGSIGRFIEEEQVSGGIMHALEKKGVPYVLAGSIRDDGPLPCVLGNAYDAQDAMRSHLRKATTVVCMATMLHTIATGNMTPSYRVLADGTVRQVYFYCVDIAEFAVNKLIDRGSLASRGIVTNVQDFIANVAKGLGL